MTDDTKLKQPTPTIFSTSRATVRCTGRLRCDCGSRLQAADIETLPNGDTLAICPICHKTWLEIERH